MGQGDGKVGAPEPAAMGSMPTPGAAVDASSFKVGAEDILYVRVWHEPEFTGTVVVHADGKVTLPLVGDIDVAGKTPIEIQPIVEKALTSYVKKPLVQVQVQEVRSKKYYLDGQVARPGEFPLVGPITILEALSKAGGIRDFANEKKIYVLRGSKRIYFNYHDVIRGKKMQQNIPLEPGDHVYVP